MIAAAIPRAFPLASLFAALSARLGGDAEPVAPLDDEAIAHLVEEARAGDTGARQLLYVQHVDREWCAECCGRMPTPRT